MTVIHFVVRNCVVQQDTSKRKVMVAELRA